MPFRSLQRHHVNGAMLYVSRMSVNPTNLVLWCEDVTCLSVSHY